ncbi:MAG: CYTH domain-containing protein [Oscillospiraceae bacterium]|nr:CYTH domain-containing protein [Oscillospiraceae bacterium]
MASELEWKFAVPDDDRLSEIRRWIERSVPEAGPAVLWRMRTTYYDAPDRRFSKAHITIRRRTENARSILCVKAPAADPSAGRAPLAYLAAPPDPFGPTGGKLRGEWECEGDDLLGALPDFVAQGAPGCLLEAAACGLEPVCGAEFTRIAIPLRFPDGSVSELALDSGRLLGRRRTVPLCELELEKKEGAETASLKLLEHLVRRFNLLPEPRSKYARARAIDS